MKRRDEESFSSFAPFAYFAGHRLLPVPSYDYVAIRAYDKIASIGVPSATLIGRPIAV